jgi:hypothetical protein
LGRPETETLAGAVEWFLPRALKWIVLGADIANRDFD